MLFVHAGVAVHYNDRLEVGQVELTLRVVLHVYGGTGDIIKCIKTSTIAKIK